MIVMWERGANTTNGNSKNAWTRSTLTDNNSGAGNRAASQMISRLWSAKANQPAGRLRAMKVGSPCRIRST
jgi:hypothetical protein